MSSITNPIVISGYQHARIFRILGPGNDWHLIGIELKDQALCRLEIEKLRACPTEDVGHGVEKFYHEGCTYYVREHYFHREDGPAIFWDIHINRQVEFWINGKKFASAEEYFEALSPEQKGKALWNLDEIK